MGERCLEAGGEVGTESRAGAVCMGEGCLDAGGEVGTEGRRGRDSLCGRGMPRDGER